MLCHRNRVWMNFSFSKLMLILLRGSRRLSRLMPSVQLRRVCSTLLLGAILFCLTNRGIAEESAPVANAELLQRVFDSNSDLAKEITTAAYNVQKRFGMKYIFERISRSGAQGQHVLFMEVLRLLQRDERSRQDQAIDAILDWLLFTQSICMDEGLAPHVFETLPKWKRKLGQKLLVTWLKRWLNQDAAYLVRQPPWADRAYRYIDREAYLTTLKELASKKAYAGPVTQACIAAARYLAKDYSLKNILRQFKELSHDAPGPNDLLPIFIAESMIEQGYSEGLILLVAFARGIEERHVGRPFIQQSAVKVITQYVRSSKISHQESMDLATWEKWLRQYSDSLHWVEEEKVFKCTEEKLAPLGQDALLEYINNTFALAIKKSTFEDIDLARQAFDDLYRSLGKQTDQTDVHLLEILKQLLVSGRLMHSAYHREIIATRIPQNFPVLGRQIWIDLWSEFLLNSPQKKEWTFPVWLINQTTPAFPRMEIHRDVFTALRPKLIELEKVEAPISMKVRLWHTLVARCLEVGEPKQPIAQVMDPFTKDSTLSDNAINVLQWGRVLVHLGDQEGLELILLVEQHASAKDKLRIQRTFDYLISRASTIREDLPLRRSIGKDSWIGSTWYKQYQKDIQWDPRTYRFSKKIAPARPIHHAPKKVRTNLKPPSPKKNRSTRKSSTPRTRKPKVSKIKITKPKTEKFKEHQREQKNQEVEESDDEF